MIRYVLIFLVAFMGFLPMYQTSINVLPKGEDSYTAPIIFSEGILFIGTSGTVYHWPQESNVWDSGYKLRLHPRIASLNDLFIFPSVFSQEISAFSSDGTKAWSLRVPGLPSAPSLSGSNILTHTNKGFLTLVNETGKIIQQDFVDVKSQIFHSYPIALDDDKVLLYGSDMDGLGGSVVLWNLSNRDEIWRFNYESIFVSPPSFNDKTVAIKSGDSEGRIFLIDLETGMLVSRVGFAGANDLRFTSIATEGDFFYLSLDSTALKLEDNGNIVWEFNGEGVFTSPVIWGEYLVLGSRNTASKEGNGIGFFDRLTGDLVYWHSLENGVNADPVVSEDTCVVIDSNGFAHFFKNEV
ncbi:hypothetical protein CL659_04460 [bacterium]|nr:hypothetical protein [bacterium]|tara:strand:- start:23145 stop:24203 length:1059 start_codon:yes stop_codon:yes gene_type:complete